MATDKYRGTLVANTDTIVLNSDIAGAVTLKSLILCNKSSAVVKYRFAIVPIADALADEHYRIYDDEILENEGGKNIICEGLDLKKGYKLYLRASTGSITWNIDIQE